MTALQGLFKPTLQFSIAIMRASLKNVKGLAAILGLPLFMLFSFWVTTQGGNAEDFDLMSIMFPAIVALGVMLSGLTQATRLAGWRAQGIFQRLALTPVPLANLVFGAALVQVVVGIVQGISVLLLGAILGIAVNWQGGLLILGVSALAAAAFIAFGSLLASFTHRTDVAAYVFFATFMPLFFLSSFPSDMLPVSLNTFIPWLPTAMAIELIGSLFVTGSLPGGALFSVLGLLVYGLIFAVIAARRFQWER
jgi:ABC-type multidrug transport system permease subunit